MPALVEGFQRRPDRLRERITDYFDTGLSHEQIARRYPEVMKSTARFDARAVRDELLKRGGPDEAGFLRHAYHRPFDIRWLYWEADGGLLDRPRPSYRQHVFEGNVWIKARKREAKEDFSRGTLVRCMADNFGNGLSSYFPVYLCSDVMDNNAACGRCANLSATAQHYLNRLGLDVEDLFHHVLATLHDPVWRETNAGALRMEWPRIPLPGWPDGKAAGAAGELVRSAAHGRELAALLDPETPVPGVTQPPLRPELAAIAVPATVSGGNMAGDDFAVTAGWGHHGQGGAVMSGSGRAVKRAFTPDEHDAMGDTLHTLGNSQANRPQAGLATFDIHLNGEAYWRNIPAAVWTYRLGGYQVLKKWLSYRERAGLGRPLSPGEAQYFADTARRIASILLLAGAGRREQSDPGGP